MLVIVSVLRTTKGTPDVNIVQISDVLVIPLVNHILQAAVQNVNKASACITEHCINPSLKDLVKILNLEA